MYLSRIFCTAEKLFDLDASVASPFTMEFVGASVVRVRAFANSSSEYQMKQMVEKVGLKMTIGEAQWKKEM